MAPAMHPPPSFLETWLVYYLGMLVLCLGFGRVVVWVNARFLSHLRIQERRCPRELVLQRYRVNFATHYSFWDRLFGTNDPSYDAKIDALARRARCA